MRRALSLRNSIPALRVLSGYALLRKTDEATAFGICLITSDTTHLSPVLTLAQKLVLTGDDDFQQV